MYRSNKKQKQSVHIGLHGKLTFKSEGNCLVFTFMHLADAFIQSDLR